MKRTEYRRYHTAKGSSAISMLVVLSAYGLTVLYLAVDIMKGPDIRLRVHTPSWQIEGTSVGLSSPSKRVYH
ncbi:hypothetical protein RHI9324_02513 [Rhizobium sp. CECT 9324]|nr:hypothetical protein RHI9324_02513 [Rhizobium sp. CECT 9324]